MHIIPVLTDKNYFLKWGHRCFPIRVMPVSAVQFSSEVTHMASGSVISPAYVFYLIEDNCPIFTVQHIKAGN